MDRDAFELSIQAPDLAGTTLYFPTVQDCVEGEAAWIEIPADGEDPHALESPAPAIDIVAASGGHAPAPEADQAGRADDADEGELAAAPVSEGDTTVVREEVSNTLAIVALVVAVVGLGVGGAAFAAGRRTS